MLIRSYFGTHVECCVVRKIIRHISCNVILDDGHTTTPMSTNIGPRFSAMSNQ